MLLHLSIKLYEAWSRSWSLFVQRPVEVQRDAELLGAVIQVSDRQSVVLQVLMWVINCMIGELSDRVRWIDLVVDEALVQLVLNLHSQREEPWRLREKDLDHLQRSLFEELDRVALHHRCLHVVLALMRSLVLSQLERREQVRSLLLSLVGAEELVALGILARAIDEVQVVERVQVLHHGCLVDACSELDQSRRLSDGDFVKSHTLVEALCKHV